MGPLEGVHLLDLTTGIAGPYATKLLADYGADVVKVERPGGDLTRGLGPFPGGEPHPEKSGTFLYFNTNKRSIVLDLKAGGAEVLGALLDWADAHGVSYLAWSWTRSSCEGEPALISDWDGTPTAYGAGIRDHLTQLRARAAVTQGLLRWSSAWSG